MFVQRGLDRKQISRINQIMPTLCYRNPAKSPAYSLKGPTERRRSSTTWPTVPSAMARSRARARNVGPLADDRLAIGVVLIGHRDQPQRGDLHRAAGSAAAWSARARA